jgi:hypothetical protein
VTEREGSGFETRRARALVHFSGDLYVGLKAQFDQFLAAGAYTKRFGLPLTHGLVRHSRELRFR